MIEIKTQDMVNDISAKNDVFTRRLNGYVDLQSVNVTEFRLMKAPIHDFINVVGSKIEVYASLLEIMTFDDNAEYLSVVDQIHRMRTIKRELSELIYR